MSFKMFKKTLQFHKNVAEGGWVCWETFTAEPLNGLLLRFQTFSKSHFGCHGTILIKHTKEPLGKGLEIHPTADPM